MARKLTLDFLKTEAASGSALALAAIAAVLVANSPWSADYFAWLKRWASAVSTSASRRAAARTHGQISRGAARELEMLSAVAVAALDVVGNIVWWKDGGVSFYPPNDPFSVDRSCRVEPVVALAQAERERNYWIARHGGALAAYVQIETELEEAAAALATLNKRAGE